MFRRITVLLFLIPLLLAGAAGLSAAPPNKPLALNDVFFIYEPGSPVSGAGNFGKRYSIHVTADSAVLMDAGTGQILYAKNPHQRRPIASTTKIMTALLAVECGNLKDRVKVSPRAAGVQGSSIYLRSGENLTLEELVYGALMNSGNDACVAIAEHVAGKEDIFIQWMNWRATLLGLKHTTFRNTNGLPHKEHLSTAYDLALIARKALKNPVFNSIVATKSHSISGPGGQRQLNNTNQMLWGYKGADGVKTGTTSAAGKCLVSSASRDGRRLIAVVLHSDDRYGDSVRLLDYGFTGFKNESVVKRGEELASINVRDGVKGQVSAGSSADVMVTVPAGGDCWVEKIIKKGPELTAPVRPGQVAGSLQVLVNGDPVAGADLVTSGSVDKLPLPRLLYQKIMERIRQ